MTAFRLTRRQALGTFSALAATLALPSLAFAAPEHGGGYDTIDLDWADAVRQRAVPLRLYLPQSAAPVPLLLFSHGMGGGRQGYSWLGRHLAAMGIASAHPQHVGSDRQLWSGNIFEIAGRLRGAANDSEAIDRVKDIAFVLDTLLSGSMKERFDERRIVAAGHSYGANTTLLAAGARVEREGRPLDLHDQRLRAAIVISAPPFYGERNTRKILSGVTLPSLHVTCTEDIIRIPGYYSGAEDRIAVFEATASPRKWLAMYEGGSHSMFTDRGGTGGVTLNPLVKAATQELSMAFLASVFEDDGSAMAAWPQRHSGILARFTAAV